MISHQEKGKFQKAENHFKIGGYNFKVLSYGDFDAHIYLKAMGHLKPENPDETDVTIHLIESKDTGLRPPEEWLNWKNIDAYSGELLDFGDRRAVSNTTEVSFILVDYHLSEIYYWVNDFSNLPPNEAAAPLRTVFHFWFDNTPLFLCHAAAIGISEQGVLLTGKSGSGKSTSTLSCLNTQLKCLGDDFVLVDSEKCIAYSLYGVAKLNIDQFEKFPHLKSLIANVEQMPKEKGHVYMNESFNGAMGEQFNIKAILLPTITGLENTTIERCSKIEAIKALVFSSVWIMRADTKAVEKMKLLILNTPTFRLMAGTKLDQIAPTISSFINES